MIFPAALASAGLVLLFAGLTEGSLASRPRGSRFATNPKMFLSTVVTGGVAAFGAYLATEILIIALAAGFFTATIPHALVGRAERHRVRRSQEAWPDALAAAVAFLRSGASIGDSLTVLAEKGPEALTPAFNAFADAYRSTGRVSSGIAALRAVADDPVADRVCSALSLAHEVGGGNLVRVLSITADAIRSDLRIRREVEARWSWTVVAARVAAVAPWVVLILMLAKPQGRQAYGSPQGIVIVVVGGLVTCLGYALMLRAARLPIARRLSG